MVDRLRGVTSHADRHNRGGNRQANAAVHRIVVTRLRAHQPNLDYVAKRKAEGGGKSEIIRYLKRFVAREVFGYLCAKPKPSGPDQAQPTPA